MGAELGGRTLKQLEAGDAGVENPANPFVPKGSPPQNISSNTPSARDRLLGWDDDASLPNLPLVSTPSPSAKDRPGNTDQVQPKENNTSAPSAADRLKG